MGKELVGTMFGLMELMNGWLYVVEFPYRELAAVIDKKSIQIKKQKINYEH